MNRRRRNTTKTITPKAVVNAVMADLRAEDQSALIQWLSNKDHRFVMEQYAKGLLSPAAPEPEPLNLDSRQVYEMIKVYTLRKQWNLVPSSVNTSNKRVFFFSVPWHGVLTSGPGVSATEQGARAWGRNSEWSVVLPLEYGKEDNPNSAYVVLDRLWTDVDSVQSETVTFGFDRDQNAASAKILANFIVDYMESRGAFPSIEAYEASLPAAPEPEPEPVAAPSGSLPISHEYREILFETVKKGKKALGLTSFRKKGDMARFLRGTDMGTQVLQIGGDEYGFWSLYSRDLPSNLRNMRPLTGDLKTDAQNIFKLIASANQQTLPRVDSFLAAAQKPKKTTAAKPSEAHPYAGHQADPNAVRRVGGETVDWIEPLYPHVSPETAYVQDDYPQGRGDKRGERRTWVEFKPKKGFRFVYQTENLRRGGWNKEKPSTYSKSALVMYLDKRDDRIYTRRLSLSDSAEAFDRFLDIFPDLPLAMIAPLYRDAMIGEFLSAKYGDPETAKAKWSPVIDRLKAMQTRSNRRGRRRSNPLRKVLYSGG